MVADITTRKNKKERLDEFLNYHLNGDGEANGIILKEYADAKQFSDAERFDLAFFYSVTYCIISSLFLIKNKDKIVGNPHQFAKETKKKIIFQSDRRYVRVGENYSKLLQLYSSKIYNNQEKIIDSMKKDGQFRRENNRRNRGRLRNGDISMIYIFIGQSGAGKTTAAKKLLPPPYTIKKEITYYTEATNGSVGIGKYGIGIRTEGTDTLPYNAQEAIRRQIKALEGRNIIIEGDRIANRKTFDFIAKNGYKAKLYLVRCPIKTSMKRLRDAGSTITETFVKTTRTKSERLFLDYERVFEGEIIET